MRCRRSNKSLVKGLLTGLAGGLAGAAVMSQFQAGWAKLVSPRQGPGEKPKKSQLEPEDATMLAAGKLAHLAGHGLTRRQRRQWAPWIHYSFGTLQGGLYGSLLEASATRGSLATALAFGAALFAVADEWAVPALGLSAPASDSPLPAHLYAAASHLVYGLSTELTRRSLRALL